MLFLTILFLIADSSGCMAGVPIQHLIANVGIVILCYYTDAKMFDGTSTVKDVRIIKKVQKIQKARKAHILAGGLFMCVWLYICRRFSLSPAITVMPVDMMMLSLYVVRTVAEERLDVYTRGGEKHVFRK